MPFTALSIANESELHDANDKGEKIADSDEPLGRGEDRQSREATTARPERGASPRAAPCSRLTKLRGNSCSNPATLEQ